MISSFNVIILFHLILHRFIFHHLKEKVAVLMIVLDYRLHHWCIEAVQLKYSYWQSVINKATSNISRITSLFDVLNVDWYQLLKLADKTE